MTELSELVAELREEARCLAGEGIGGDLADKFTKAAAAIERLEREVAENAIANSRLAEQMERTLAELEKVREALTHLLRCEYEGPGLRDCTDNNGVAYQSADLARHIAAAEELVAARALSQEERK